MKRKRAFFPLLALMAALLGGCTLKPEIGSKRQTSSVEKFVIPTDLQVSGKVKVDEFNDQATGKEIPADGGQISVEMAGEPNSLNVWISGDAATAEIDGYLFDSLLRQDPETLKWEGQLAERWTEEDILVENDGTKLRGIISEPTGPNGASAVKNSSGGVTNVPRQDVKDIRKAVSFTFYLRRGVRFHDGVPLTAADVKFSFDTIKNDYVDDAALRNYYKDLESCEVLDNYTIRLTYAQQYWGARMYAGGFMIIPKHIYDADNLLEKDPEAFGKRFNDSPENRRPIGSGQYKFDKWDTGIQIVLKRNDDYWEARRRGHLDTISYRHVSDPIAALQALKNGEINFLPATTAEQFEKDTNSPDFLAHFVKGQYFTPNMNYIGWNMRRPPFNDRKVRLAMAYGALNRQEFLDKVLYGHGIIVTQDQYYFGPAYDHSIQPYPFDPDKARRLLLEAGWYDRDGDGLRDKDGVPFRFEMLLPSGTSVARQRAALMQDNLRKLGIEMDVRELEWATYLENINDRKFDAYNGAWVMDPENDPYQLWHTSQSANRGSNIVGFGNAETDKLIEESRITLDDTARWKLMFEFGRIEHETQPYLFLYTAPSLTVYDKRYRGAKFYRIRPDYDFSEWYLPQAAQANLAER